LEQVNLMFRCKDAYTKKTYELSLEGEEVLAWLPKSFDIDFSTKFRRNKFGAYILQYLSMRFQPGGEIDLFLVQEKS
jgi:hypothetical protein